MSNIWFCSDLHLGHKNVGKFRAPMGPEWASESDNRATIVQDFISNVTKRCVVYCLGDIAFTMEAIDLMKSLPGRKILIRGNHDTCNTSAYLKAFDEVYGLIKYKGFWLSHAPIHKDELRGKKNLHGHVHYNSVRVGSSLGNPLDPDYFNCCPEALWPKYGRCLVSLDEVRQHFS